VKGDVYPVKGYVYPVKGYVYPVKGDVYPVKGECNPIRGVPLTIERENYNQAFKIGKPQRDRSNLQLRAVFNLTSHTQRNIHIHDILWKYKTKEWRQNDKGHTEAERQN